MEIVSQLITQNILWLSGAFFLYIIISALGIIFLGRSLGNLRRRNEELFSGNKAKDLEEIILAQGKTLKILDKDIQELYNISNQINSLAQRSLHKTAMIRFNPFKDLGGDQSFSIALLNGKNDGILISSLHTKEGTRIYSKTVAGGTSSKHPFTEEEEQVIKIAIENAKSKKI